MAGEGRVTAGQAKRRLPEDICQLIGPVSLGQFLSHVVPSLSYPRHLPSLPFKLSENLHCSHEHADRNGVPAAASGCWQSFMGLFLGWTVWLASTPQEMESQLQFKWVLSYLHLWELCWRPKAPFPGPGRSNGRMEVPGISRAPTQHTQITLVCNVFLQPCLPPPHGFGCLCSRSALILHSPGLGSVQHLKNLIQSYGLHQVTPAIVCAGA